MQNNILIYSSPLLDEGSSIEDAIKYSNKDSTSIIEKELENPNVGDSKNEGEYDFVILISIILLLVYKLIVGFD